MTEDSPGGSRIYRHRDRERAFEPAHGDEALLAAVEAHVEEHIGEIETVFHELVSDLVHVDVLQVPPAEGRPWWTLVTCGMAARPMSPPPEVDGADRFAELVLCLPPDWPLDEAKWPFGLLQFLARLPHEYETWFAAGHTVPNGDPPEPLAPDTELSGVILAPPLLGPEGFERIAGPEGDIALLGVIALYSEEMQLKLDEGTDALHDRLDEGDVSEMLEIRRPSVAPPRRRRFGFGRR